MTHGKSETACEHIETLRHIIGHSWRGGSPTLQMWSLPDQQLRSAALDGDLTLTPLADRRCVGRRDADRGGRVACPYTAAIQRGTQCDRCRFEDGFYLCITCDGTRCPVLPPAVERYCRQTHHLYLMDIGANTLKVGTAVDGRQHLRVLEQGPVAAALVATGPGPTIKRLEKAVSRLGLRERFATSHKASFAFRSTDVARGRQRILEAFSLLQPGVPADLAATLHAPEFVPLPTSDRPSAPDTEPGALDALPLRPIPVRAGHTIHGHIRAVRGAFALLDLPAAPGVLGVLDLTQLRSRLVDLAPAASSAPTALPPAQLRLL